MFNWIIGIPLLTLFAVVGLAITLITSTRQEPGRPTLNALLVLIALWTFCSFMFHSISFPSTEFWLYLIIICAACTGAVSVHFSAQFTYHTGRIARWIVGIFYIAGAISIVLLFTGQVVVEAELLPNGAVEIGFSPLVLYIWIMIACMTLAALVFLITALISSSSSMKRYNTFPLIGVIVMGIGAFSNTLISSYPIDIAANFIFVSMVSYGVVSRQLLRPSIRLPWPQVLSVTIFLLALCYAAMFIFCQAWLGYTPVNANIIAGLTILTFGIVMFGPTRKSLLNVLERWLFPNTHRYQHALAKLASLDSSLNQWENSVINALNIITEATRAKGAVLLLRNEKTGYFEATYTTRNELINMSQIKLPIDSPLVTYLNTNNVTLSSEEMEQYLDMRVVVRGEDDILREVDSTLYGAIQNSKGLLAILAIMRSSREGWYEDEARDFLKLACHQIATNTINAELYHASQREIMERKRVEKKVQALYQQEKALRQELESEIKKRMDFSHALVHELKTPLTPIVASSDLLAGALKEQPFLDIAKNIYRGAQNLSRRIDELLDLARGELGMIKLSLNPVDLQKMLRKVVDEMAPMLTGPNKSLRLELPAPLPRVTADAVRLEQVMMNLLTNANKFTLEGGTITVRAKQEDDMVTVSVSDTGSGISKKIQERLFDPYYRDESDRQRLSGLGLGLALCKTLVELHGGRIWVESSPGAGSTFSFSIPIEPTFKGPIDSGAGE